MGQQRDETGPPSPYGGWSEQVLTLPCAVIEPLTGSVYYEEAYVHQAALFRNGTIYRGGPSEARLPLRRLEGQHLWGGLLIPHFGHFLTESISRLWAATNDVESILFTLKDPRPEKFKDVSGFQREMFSLLGVRCPVHIVREPILVEQLSIPGQGYGLGDISFGTSKFHTFVRHFGKEIEPKGAKKLYLSRSELPKKTGSFIAETALEANLRREGYRIFHPQKHSIEDQVAQFKAATHVLGADGSAFHLAGFVATSVQKYGMILRRTAPDYLNIVNQYAGMGVDMHVFDHIQANWIRPGKSKPDDRSYGELDQLALAADLAQDGFIDRPEDWDLPTASDVSEELNLIGTAHGGIMSRLSIKEAMV